jgi:hypothetical protein
MAQPKAGRKRLGFVSPPYNDVSIGDEYMTAVCYAKLIIQSVLDLISSPPL